MSHDAQLGGGRKVTPSLTVGPALSPTSLLPLSVLLSGTQHLRTSSKCFCLEVSSVGSQPELYLHCEQARYSGRKWVNLIRHWPGPGPKSVTHKGWPVQGPDSAFQGSSSLPSTPRPEHHPWSGPRSLCPCCT